MPSQAPDISGLSLVPLEEGKGKHNRGPHLERKKQKPSSDQHAQAELLAKSSGAQTGDLPLFLAPQNNASDVPKAPSLTHQPEGPWSYKLQTLPTIQPAPPPSTAQSTDFSLPRLDVSTKTTKSNREESSPAGAAKATAGTRSVSGGTGRSLDASLPSQLPRRHSPRAAFRQQQQQPEALQGGAFGWDSIHSAQV
ncbi:hypothetical protein DUNSADRAFT_2203 [Dunaliella salina]|uniref:Encoded protein n=1 Tax=Dunaliella salina TaxID=3046 RepID=A0ABQ7GW27_DUNSA|nr:hypothetical protein DUNSADRAFT_2203 [Dunaliella salina]|eukprot:KAF5838818.1 hypothetical protein DUNSADRAFT_2203 [Dunaliella salina]